MFPAHYYYFRKSTQAKYTYTPTGDMDVNKLIRSKAYWKQSVSATTHENKTLILADWTVENWSNEKRLLMTEKLIELIDAGFSVYFWQSGQIEEINKDNLIQLLKEPQVLERIASPALPKDIESVVISQLPNAVKDNILILDDYQINGLLHPEAFTYPRELDVAELLKYKHDKKRITAILGKMNPPITGFTDTNMSDESYQILEQLQKDFPGIAIKSQFKSAKLTTQIIEALLKDGKATVARRTLQLEQLENLEEVTLEGLSKDALVKIIPYLSSVKKLTLLNFKNILDLNDTINISLPNLEKIKLLKTDINTTDLVSIIKNAPRLKKLDNYNSHIVDDGPFSPLSSKCIDTIKNKHGAVSKRNFQDLVRNHKIKRILFENTSIISDSLTEIKDADLSSIKIIEIDKCSCSAEYLDQMFGLLPQLEQLRIHGGTIKSFTNTFSLKFLKILDIDLQRFNDLASAFDNLEIEELILVDKNTSDVPKLGKLNLSRMNYFSLSKNKLNHELLEDVLKRASRLKHLDLHGCTNLDTLTIKSSLATIDTLNLSETDISAESLERILEKAPKLKRLDLSGCSQLELTPKLRSLMNRIQVYYPDHVRAERKKPVFSTYAASSNNTDNQFQKEGQALQLVFDAMNGEPIKIVEDPDGIKISGGTGDDTGNGTGDSGDDSTFSDEQDIDADTTFNENKQFTPTVTFFPINEDTPIPAVSQYRDQIFNKVQVSEKPCPITKAFKLKNIGDLQLQSCSPIACSNDVFDEASKLEQSPDHQYYYGKKALKLTRKWLPVPSLSSQELMTHYHIEPQNSEVELKYSLRDNQYYIRSKNDEQKNISIDFLLKVPTKSKQLPKEIQDLVDVFVGSLSEPGYSAGPLVINKENPTGIDYLNALLDQKKGACRHRAVAFEHLMKKHFPSIPVRVMTNTVHAQVEVFIDNEWIICNLGGYPAQLKLNKKNDPRKKERLPLQKEYQLSELNEEDAQIAQFLQTWKKTKQPELSLDAYCQKLTEPRQQKKYLIDTSNPVSLQALALALKSHCKKNNRPVFHVKKPDHLACSTPFITNKDNIGSYNEGPGGPLHTFLTKTYDKSNPPIIIIDAQQFGTDDLVQHNSIFDDKPKVDGTPLPEGTIVILLMNSSKPNSDLGEDLSSRMDVKEICPIPDKILNQEFPLVDPKPAENETRASAKIDLFKSDNWEGLLLGQWTFNGNHLFFEEGLLQKALKEHSLITIANGLWEDSSFQQFWQEARQDGFIDYEGQRIVLPKDFDIVKKEGYDWNQLAAAVEFKDGVNLEAECLNHNLLPTFFLQYEYLERTKGMKKLSGLIQNASGKELVVNLTRELDVNEWAKLLSECNIHKVRLVCNRPPGVKLPEALQHKHKSDEKQKPLTAWDKTCSPCMIIKSTDRDTTVHQLTQQLSETVFIDVSELEAFDLLGLVNGEFDQKTHLLQFTRVEKALTLALKANKNVILTGQLSNSLLDLLMPHLLRRAQDPKAKGTLALVLDDKCEYTLPLSTRHQVSVDEKVEALKKYSTKELIQRLTDAQLEKDSLSQLKARLRYLKKHPLAKESSKAWDGLEKLSTHMELAPFDLNQSEAITKAIIKEQLQDILSRLSESPMAYLSGLTGVGKTTFVEKYLSKAPNVTVYFGEENIKKWADDKSKKLKIIFIDEANIGQRQWSEFEGLLLDEPSIVTKDGQHYFLNKDRTHVVLFAGNPLNYGNDRQLAPLFKRHGNAKVFEPMKGEYIYEEVLKPLFENTDLHDQSKEISQLVLALYRHLVNLSTNEVLISTRELQLIVLLTLSCYQRGEHKDVSKIAAHYIYQIGSTMVPFEHKKDFDAAFKPKEPLYPKLLAPFKLKHSNYLITPSRYELYLLILDLLELRKFKQAHGSNEAQKYGGLGGIILEGDPGIGKSELVRAVLFEHQFQEATLAHEPAKDDLLYQIPISMRNEQKMALLLKGLAKAAALILDEINSAPVLERWLNDILMNKDPITKAYPKIPGVLLFGTQNPVTMGGRQRPSNAVKRRILHYVLPVYSREEMVAILINEGLSTLSAERMVRVYIHLVNYARQNYLSPVPTFRDLLRLARIASNLNNINALNDFYASIDKPSLRQALMKAEDRFDSHTVLALAKHLKPETIRIFDLHIRLFEFLILTSMPEKKIQFMLSFLCILMPKTGEIDDKKIQGFMSLCELDIEKVPQFEKLNEIFVQNPAMLDDFFKALTSNELSRVANLIIENSDLAPLISSILASENTGLVSTCVKDATDYLKLVKAYKNKYPDTDIGTQLALVEVYHFLMQHYADAKESWSESLMQINHQELIKLQKTIHTADTETSREVFSSIFNIVLMSRLDSENTIEYIKLMINDEQLRALNVPPFNAPDLVKLFIAKSKTINPQEIMNVLMPFENYPQLIQYLLESKDGYYLFKEQPKKYSDFIKTYEAKNQGKIPVEVQKYIILLHQMLTELAPKDKELWDEIILESSPEEIKNMFLLLFSEVTDQNVLKALFEEANKFAHNETLNIKEPEKISYFKLIKALSGDQIVHFTKLTSLMNNSGLSLSHLLERLKTTQLNQLLQFIQYIPNTDLVCYLLSDKPQVQQAFSYMVQQPKLHAEFINNYSAKTGVNKKNLLQAIDLHHSLYTQAPSDQSIWQSILLEASPEEINQMHQWMNSYQKENKSLFLNLVYSRAHQLKLNQKDSLTEEALCKHTKQLLNQSAIELFDFNKPFKYSADRVQLMHHLENKTFVVPGTSIIQSLWTELKNSALLKAIYDAYSLFIGSKTQDKEVLLLVAKELTAVPSARQTAKIDLTVTADLSNVVSNYLGSFWIRTQRKNSARALLSSINNDENDYVAILNSIQTARNEVFTNDTEKERNMHRNGSSRYYETLNQLEDMLINYWVSDKNALSSFKAYPNHYETTLNHSKQCFSNAIKFENEKNNTHYNSDTELKDFPGYLKALKTEVQLRESSFKKYQLLLEQTVGEEDVLQLGA
jgi:hypothetical protein